MLLWAEHLQSHILHIGYLAAPDLLNVNSVMPLVATHKDAVLLIIKLHRLANETCDLIGGRATHPIRTMVGGWTMLPKPQELEALKNRWRGGDRRHEEAGRRFVSLAGGLPELYAGDRIRQPLRTRRLCAITTA